MKDFNKKTLRTSRGYMYTYYTIDGDKSLPTLFFQHGWPDNAELWKDVAYPLRVTKHPIIVPDLLGYDGTDKPTDPREYAWNKLLPDLIEIADKEDAHKLISIGHDFGSVCASHLYCYYRDRVVGLVNINVPYAPPSREPFDLDAFNAFTQRKFGYTFFGYWYLFTADDGPQVLQKDPGRLYEVLHGQGEDNLKKFFGVRDFLRNHLLNGGLHVPVRPYAQDETAKQAFIDRFNRDGFDGPQCWYKARFLNIQYECDKDLPLDRDTVNVPALFLGGKDDPICRPESMIPHIQAGLLPKLEQRDLFDAGHWTPLEIPNELVRSIEQWLKKNYT